MLRDTSIVLIIGLLIPSCLLPVTADPVKALIGHVPDAPETVFIKISRANKALLSIEKGPALSITPEQFQDACSLQEESNNLHVDLSDREIKHAITLCIPRKAIVFFLTAQQEFPNSAQEMDLE